MPFLKPVIQFKKLIFSFPFLEHTKLVLVREIALNSTNLSFTWTENLRN